MEQLELLHRCLLLLADEVNRICEKYDIPYYIIGGTLLGAVRHKGFIPWDDDFDLGILRKDYEKFLEVCKQELGEKFYLQNDCSEENYCFAFTKIQLKGTEIIEEFSKDVDVSHGIFIDVFPLDNIPDNAIKKRLFYIKNHILKNLIWIKCGYGTRQNKKKISYRIFKVLSKCYSVERLKRCRYELLTRYEGEDSKCRFISDYPHCVFKNSYFSRKKMYCFEDKRYMGFENYDDFLSGFYGEYMKLPSEEKRVVHTQHKIDFGRFYDEL